MANTNMYRKHYYMILILAFIVFQNINADSNVTKLISNIDGLSNNSVNCIWEDSEHTMWFGTWGGLNAYNGREIKVYKYNNKDPNSISNNIVRQISESGNYLWIATDNGINKLNKTTGQITRYYLQGRNGQIPDAEKTYIIGRGHDGTIYCWHKNKGLYVYRNNKFDLIHTDFTSKVKYVSVTSAGIWFLFNDGSVRFSLINSKTIILKESNLRLICNTASNLFVSDDMLIIKKGVALLLYDNYLKLTRTIPLMSKLQISQVLFYANKLYIGFIGGGCISYDFLTSSYSPVAGVPSKLSVFTLFVSSQRILWLGTDGQGVEQLYRYTPLFNTVFSPFPVRCFFDYRDGQILVGTKGSGLQLLNTVTRKLTAFRNEKNGLISNSVYALCKNDQNDIFIGTDGYGLNILNVKTGRLKKLQIPSIYPLFRSVYNIHLTNHGSVLWLGTAGYGLIKMDITKNGGTYIVKDLNRYSSADRPHTLNNDIIYAIASEPDGSFVWFGTRGGGLYRFDVNASSICRLDNLKVNNALTNDDILCLYGDSHGLLIGTSYGLNRMSPSGSGYSIIKYSDRNLSSSTIHGIIKDLLGNVWLSTSQGLYKISNRGRIENYTIKDGLQNNEFSDGAYYEDESGNLYFGGVSGLNYFNPQKIHLRNFVPQLDLCGLKIYDRDVDIAPFMKKGVLKLEYDERNVTFKFIAKDYINTASCEYAYRLKDNSEKWIDMGTDPNLIFQLAPGKHILEVKCSNGDKVWNNHVYRLSISVGNPWWFSLWAILSYLLILAVITYVTLSVIRNRIRMSRRLFLADIDKKQGQKIFESKLNFFTNVAHEFYTPLTLIYTPAQYLSEMPDISDEIKKYIDVIKDNAERMQGLMQELIEFRKSKSSYEPLCPEKIVIEDHIRSITDSYDVMRQRNRIDFQVNTHDMFTLVSDRSVLSNIIFNLISNAFKHTPQGGYIMLEVFQESTDNTSLHIVIKNSGKGMTEEQMEDVFDEYKIFDPINSGGGLQVSNGIGMNLVKKMIEYLGGTIEINSELNKYVELVVVIPPLDMNREDIIKLEPDKDQIQLTDAHDREKLHAETNICIIEDDQNICNLLLNILYDYTVMDFSDSDVAVESISKNHPDLIIADLHLEITGSDFVGKLKSDPKTNYIPIIGIAGKTSVEEQIDAYNNGVDVYLVKPFHPRQILSSIENLLTRQTLLKDYFNSSLSSLTIRNGKVLHHEDVEMIEKVNDFIKKHIDDDSLSPEMIEQYLGQSRASLYRKFKELSDKTPSEYIKNMRLEFAAKLLKTTKMTVSEIIYKSGFSNKSYFYREFQKLYGSSPNDYRKK